MKGFTYGEEVYFVESNRQVVTARILFRRGNFYTIELPSGGAITLREGRLFQDREEAEGRCLRKSPSEDEKENRKPEPDIRRRSQYECFDPTSRYGI